MLIVLLNVAAMGAATYFLVKQTEAQVAYNNASHEILRACMEQSQLMLRDQRAAEIEEDARRRADRQRLREEMEERAQIERQRVNERKF